MNRREFLTTGTGMLAAAGLPGYARAAGDITAMRTESKAVQDLKRAKLAALKELGPTITDFEVRRRDSIVVRAEVTVPEWNSDEPQAVTDQLIFTLESGVVQQVTLSVVGQDAFFLDSRTLTQDTTLTARRPILVRGWLTVGEGVTVTMEAGTRLLFHDDAGMTVDGRIVVNGT